MLLLGTGCTGPTSQTGAKPGGVQQISVQASEFKFEPANFTARANQPAEVTLRNTGTVLHDWTVQGLDQPVHLEAQPGQTSSGQFTPARPGTYRVICAQPGHEQAGMVGQLVVQ